MNETTKPGALKNETAEAALEALERHLATRPDETVRAVARLVKLLPCGRQGRVFAPTRGLFDVLAGLPGARLVNVPARKTNERHLRGVTVDVDGVEFEALYRVEAVEPAEAAP